MTTEASEILAVLFTERQFDKDWLFRSHRLTETNSVLGANTKHVLASFMEPCYAVGQVASIHVASTDEATASTHATHETFLDFVAENLLVPVRRRRLPCYQHIVT